MRSRTLPSLRSPSRLVLLAAFALAALGAALSAHAQVYNKFGPSTGVLKGSTSTYQTSAAASSDIVSLFSGCSGVLLLGADGACHAGGGGGGGGVPTTIPSLVLWYKADVIDSAASTPTVGLPNWAPNYIGIGVAIGANPFTVSTTQLNSLPTITLPANTQMTLMIYSASNTQRGPLLHNSTMFVVANPSTLSGGSGIGSDIMSGSSNPALEVRVSTAGILSLQAQGVATIATSTSAVITVGSWGQFNYTYNDTSGAYVFRSNRTANGSGTSAGHTISQPETSLLWFGGAGGFNLDWIGSVAEVIVYNRDLTPTEVTTVETYLHTKWGV